MKDITIKNLADAASSDVTNEEENADANEEEEIMVSSVQLSAVGLLATAKVNLSTTDTKLTPEPIPEEDADAANNSNTTDNDADSDTAEPKVGTISLATTADIKLDKDYTAVVYFHIFPGELSNLKISATIGGTEYEGTLLTDKCTIVAGNMYKTTVTMKEKETEVL